MQQQGRERARQRAPHVDVDWAEKKRAELSRAAIIGASSGDAPLRGAGNAAWYASRSNGATAVGVSQRLICIVFSRALNMEKYGYEERKHSVSGNLG